MAGIDWTGTPAADIFAGTDDDDKLDGIGGEDLRGGKGTDP